MRFGAYVVVIFMFCCLGISTSNAQEGGREYVPFVEEGKVWYCGYVHPGITFPITPEDPHGEGIDCIFTMCGDTLIGDWEYKKVYCQFGEYYDDDEQHYYCAVREEAYQVFIIEEETTEERLIYDFSRPGELIILTHNGIKLARTGGDRNYFFLPGQRRHLICTYSNNEVDYSNSPGVWVVGVGAPFRNPFAFEFHYLLFDKAQLGKDIIVRTCMKDGKYIYMQEWMDEPMEPESIIDITHTDYSPKGTYLYDLQGCSVDGTQKGILIRNGKKVLVK